MGADDIKVRFSADAVSYQLAASPVASEESLALIRYSARLMLAGEPVMVTWRSVDPSTGFAILIWAPDICLISLILDPWRPMMHPIRSFGMVISWELVWAEASIPVNPWLLGAMGKGLCCIASWCSLVSCGEIAAEEESGCGIACCPCTAYACPPAKMTGDPEGLGR